MSQVYKILTSAGPTPPAIPTQFTADDATIAVPTSNNLNVFSRDTTDSNDNGVQTTADPNGDDNLYLELTNRIIGTATTTDAATPVQVYSFNLGATPATYLFEVRLIAYNVTDGLSAGYTSFRTTKTDGAAATDISATPGIVSEETTMTGVLAVNSVSGNNLLLTVNGLLGKTIHWKALTTYIMVV